MSRGRLRNLASRPSDLWLVAQSLLAKEGTGRQYTLPGEYNNQLHIFSNITRN